MQSGVLYYFTHMDINCKFSLRTQGASPERGNWELERKSGTQEHFLVTASHESCSAHACGIVLALWGKEPSQGRQCWLLVTLTKISLKHTWMKFHTSHSFRSLQMSEFSQGFLTWRLRPDAVVCFSPLNSAADFHDRKQGCQSNTALQKQPITGEPALPRFPPPKCQNYSACASRTWFVRGC